jgi:hypothetical protein
VADIAVTPRPHPHVTACPVTAATAQDANITEIDSNLAISGPGVTVTQAG